MKKTISLFLMGLICLSIIPFVMAVRVDPANPHAKLITPIDLNNDGVWSMTGDGVVLGSCITKSRMGLNATIMTDLDGDGDCDSNDGRLYGLHVRKYLIVALKWKLPNPRF